MRRLKCFRRRRVSTQPSDEGLLGQCRPDDQPYISFNDGISATDVGALPEAFTEVFVLTSLRPPLPLRTLVATQPLTAGEFHGSCHRLTFSGLVELKRFKVPHFLTACGRARK